MEKRELKLGQTVYLKPQGNAARRSTEIKTDVIKTIGSKYFTLEHNSRYKFSLETMQEHSDYSSEYTVYLSEKAISDENDLYKLRSEIKKHSFSLSELREINLKYNFSKD